MKIVTGCNAGYYGRIQAYLNTLEADSNIPAVFVAVGFEADPGLSKIQAVSITHAQNFGAQYEKQFIQHG
jgi:hypothetical protein